MSETFRRAVFLPLCALLLSCSAQETRSTDPNTPAANEARSDALNDPSACRPQRPHYDLGIRLEPEAHRIEVKGTVRLQPTSSPREILELSLSEQMRDVRLEVIEPATSAGAAQLESTTRPYSRPGWGTTTWRLRPANPVPAAEPVLVRFSYRGEGDGAGFIYYIGAPASFGAGITTAWYPQLESAAVRPDGRLRGCRATGTLTFTLPEGFRAYAEGKPLSSPGEEASGTFRFQAEAPIYFSFGAGRYVVRQREGSRNAAICFLRERPTMDDYLTGALNVVDVLSREFGPYPFSRFAIVEVPTGPADRAGFAGASVDGFIFATTDFLEQPFNTAYYGHEVGHQWWGNQVKAADRGSWMMSEGMAQYGSLRAVELLEGAGAAERYRRTGYPGFFDHGGLTYLMLSAAGSDAPLADLPPDGALPRMLADSKGFLVWDMLSQTVGREKFREVLAEFTREHADQRVPWATLLEAISAGAGRDLGWFYDRWFEGTGALDWTVAWEQHQDALAGTVTLGPDPVHSTIDVKLEGKGCPSLVRQLTLEGLETRFKWHVPCQVDKVTLDPAFQLLHWTPEYRAAATALAPWTRANLLLNDGSNAEAEAAFRAALAAAPAEDPHGLHFMLRYGLGQALIAQDKHKEARQELEAALASPLKRPAIVPSVYLELARVARKLEDDALLRRAARGAADADLAAFGRPVVSPQISAMLAGGS